MDGVEDDPRSRYTDFSCVTPLEHLSNDLEGVLRGWHLGTLFVDNDAYGSHEGPEDERRTTDDEDSAAAATAERLSPRSSSGGGGVWRRAVVSCSGLGSGGGGTAAGALELDLQLYARPCLRRRRLRRRPSDSCSDSGAGGCWGGFLASGEEEDGLLAGRWRSERSLAGGAAPEAICEWFGLRRCLVVLVPRRSATRLTLLDSIFRMLRIRSIITCAS